MRGVHHQSQPSLRITGLAGSHGPMTTFLYRCNPMSRQLQVPIPSAVLADHRSMPISTACQDRFCDSVTPKPPPATRTRVTVSMRSPCFELWRRCLRKTGNKPKTWMLNNMRLKTCVALRSREAKTVDDITAALVEMGAGNLIIILEMVIIDIKAEGKILILNSGAIVEE